MGRGRAKAKQTKVARELKYNTGSLDPDRLKRELEAGGFASVPSSTSDDTDDGDDYADPYASDEDDEDDEDEPAAR
ncbi:MAG: DUF3073 domain-containing protein [Mycobacteriales bacterium]|nr:DUF3073 domain-containing protein [Mycobacteriales bacterium]